MTARVEIYTTNFCGYCSRAKSLLTSKGVKFEEYKAGSNAEQKREMIQRSNGGYTFPQIFINGRHVGGSDEIHDLDRQGKLDPLLAEAAA